MRMRVWRSSGVEAGMLLSYGTAKRVDSSNTAVPERLNVSHFWRKNTS